MKPPAPTRPYRILVPLDGSAQSEVVLPFLNLLASKADVEVELLRCFEPPSAVYAMSELDEHLNESQLQALMLRYLQTKQGALKGIPSQVRVACGEPSSEILDRSEGKDFVVLASRGRRAPGRWRIGSVTMRIASFSPKPVLVIPSAPVGRSRLETLLVGLDGSVSAERALSVGAKLAKDLSAGVILFQAVPKGLGVADPEVALREARVYLENLAKGYPEQPMSIEVRTDGKIDLAERAEELGADLVALGSHGLRDPARRVMGSTAEDALHQARCPVLVVR